MQGLLTGLSDPTTALAINRHHTACCQGRENVTDPAPKALLDRFPVKQTKQSPQGIV